VALVILVAQRLRARQAELAAITGDFDERQVELEHTETDLDALGGSIDRAAARLRELDAQITAIERRYPGGIPQAEYADYSALVAQRNDLAAEHDALVNRHGALVEDYRRSVDRHNARVKEANALARRSTPWSVVGELWDGLVASRPRK